MEFGLFTEFHSPPGVSEAARRSTNLRPDEGRRGYGLRRRLARRNPFPERSIGTCVPLVIASALAACTRRVKIGIAVQVLPLSHPLRLAEDVATVDHISKGRLEFGVGRSGLPGHYQGFNILYSESRDSPIMGSTFSSRTSASCPSHTRSRIRRSGRDHLRRGARRLRGVRYAGSRPTSCSRCASSWASRRCRCG